MPSLLAENRTSDQSPATDFDHPAPLALQLSDTQLDEIMRLCQPLALHCRDALLRILAYELRGRVDVGDGELHRLVRTIISDNRLFDPPLKDQHGARKHIGKYAR
jgi:hypothetical protein